MLEVRYQDLWIFRHKLGISEMRTLLIIWLNYKIVTEILNSSFHYILMLFNKLYEKNSNKVWKTKKKSEYTNKYLNRQTNF